MNDELEYHKDKLNMSRELYRLIQSPVWQDFYLKLIESEITKARQDCLDISRVDEIRYNIGLLDGLSKSVSVIDNVLKEMVGSEEYLQKSGVDINHI